MNWFFRRFLLLLFIGILCACSNSTSETSSNLPDISTFSNSPSDQFIVDMNVIADGHMYRGKNANDPHTGAHVHFKSNSGASPDWPEDTLPDAYPEIYAFADGTISKIDTYYEVTNAEKTHCRYGITLDFAQQNGQTIKMSYSIEPMIDPGDETYYMNYIKVNDGDTVYKGDVIAYMYLSTEATINKDHHIHFNLIKSNATQAPVLFTNDIMSQFVEKISTANGGIRNFEHPTGWVIA
jgi:hypothetical protein